MTRRFVVALAFTLFGAGALATPQDVRAGAVGTGLPTTFCSSLNPSLCIDLSGHDFEWLSHLTPQQVDRLGEFVAALQNHYEFDPSLAQFYEQMVTVYRPTDVGPHSVVPEPSTWIMLATGLFALGLVAWRRNRGEGPAEA